mmetsp:Transcript_147379/g.270740  ORF Transcript_147379/g.270740 Transcript_147379/m.270740 type:complete len:202 (+) Transcript_147379:97-702(+)
MRLEALAALLVSAILIQVLNLAQGRSTVSHQETPVNLGEREWIRPWKNRQQPRPAQKASAQLGAAGHVTLLRKDSNAPHNPHDDDPEEPPQDDVPAEPCGKSLFDDSICPEGTYKYVCDQTMGYYHGTAEMNTPATAGGGPRCHIYLYINEEPPECEIGFCEACTKALLDGLEEGPACKFTYERGDPSDGTTADQCKSNTC